MNQAGERHGMAKHQRRIATAASRAARTAPKPLNAPTTPPLRLQESTPAPSEAHSSNHKRQSYLEAVAVYEQGIRQIQQHDFARAADLLGRVVAAFPQERELCERARLYLSLCDRQLRPAADEPQSLAERIYAATLALNAGRIDRAIAFLESVLREDPTNDQALYMLATAYAQRGDVQVAIPYLQQAIESNPDNRVLARVDPDLADLRAEDNIAALLESPLLQPDGDPSTLRPAQGRREPSRGATSSGSSRAVSRDDRKRSVRTRSAR